MPNTQLCPQLATNGQPAPIERQVSQHNSAASGRAGIVDCRRWVGAS